MGPCLSALQYFKMSGNCEARISIFRRAWPRGQTQASDGTSRSPTPPRPGPDGIGPGDVGTEIGTVGTDGKSGARRSSEKYAPPAGEGLEAGRGFMEGKHPLVG